MSAGDARPPVALPDFRTLFERLPGLYLVLDPQLRIVAVTDAYARATLTRREDIVGRDLFEVFPDNPDDSQAAGSHNLRVSLARVLAERVDDAMPVQKYDIREAPGSDRFETRYWSPYNAPVLADDGSVACIVHRVEDVTGFVRSLADAGAQGGTVQADRAAAEVLARANEVAATKETLARRVDERTAELLAANEALRNARRAALNLVDDAEQARLRAERELARARTLLEHLGLLDHITRAIGERQDLASIFQVVVQALEGNLPVDFACILRFDAAARTLEPVSAGQRAAAVGLRLPGPLPVDANGLARCLDGQLVYEPDLSGAAHPFTRGLAAGGLRSVVMAPLRAESQVFGVLVAARAAAGAFSSADCEFLRQLSEHVALAVHQAQLYASLQQAYDDLRQTQQAVMQEERLRVLGQMASGIAHDINNALSPVSLYTESMLETESGLSARGRGYLETIRRAVEDVAETVARMREFYRRRETQLELTPVDLNRMVGQVVDLTRARWSDMALHSGAAIEPQLALESGLPPVMGVESEIREALTNLVFNAVDAMPQGGRLTLRTWSEGADDARRVTVEVGDSGVGMDDETRRRCLEPFFTTKGEQGTGLGLAMVFGMVQRHSAQIDIDSAPAAGTRVRLQFSAQVTALAQPVAAAAARPHRRLRLLLVDDDPVLIRSMRDALELDGHAAEAMPGGREGIACFQEAVRAGQPFDAVLTDLGMPYVDGRKVAQAVKAASPNTPVVLLTGWGQRLVADGEIPAGVDRVLAKPPKLAELRLALSQLCGPGGGA